MTSSALATTLNCTPQYVRNTTKKANDKGLTTISIKGETYSFVEVVTVASRGKAYCYTSVENIIKKRKTTSKSISFVHLSELETLDITAKKHSKEEKLLLITFINKYNYTLKIIVESLLAEAGEMREPKRVASLTRKIQRWRKEFSTKGAKALDDKRGTTRNKFSKIDEELLIGAIKGAGQRGIRENYYGVWDFYCYSWQKKYAPDFNTENKKIISYSALTKGIKHIFETNYQVKMFWKKGKDGLLQGHMTGIKDITYTNQEWQVDATKFDFMCTKLDENGKLKVGRYNLTAVIDVHTGNAVATLTEQIDSYAQIRVLNKAFERMGKPENIYTDNGMDYVSKHYEAVLEDLGITQIKANVGQGREKGKVERFFGVLQTDLAKLPGYIGNNVAKRTIIEDQTASKIDIRTSKATRINPARLLTFEELQTIINNKLAKTSSSYAEHIEQLLSTDETENIRRKLGKRAVRKVHAEGIHYEGITYTSVALWEGGLNQGINVEVYEDIDNSNTIYVYHDGTYIGKAFNRELKDQAMNQEEFKRSRKAHRANHITPTLKSIKNSAELYAMYEDHNAKKLLEDTPEYAKPKPKEEKKKEVVNNDYLNFALKDKQA